MTFSEIATYRLRSQQITETNLKSATEMVTWFGAIQAQEYAQTKWGLGFRLPHMSDKDIEQEITDGNILRTHLLRPTWHFITSTDIQWLLKLTANRVNAANVYMYKKLELNDNVLNRCNKIIETALQKNKELTRDDLNEELKKKKIKAEGLRLSYIMMFAELSAVICSGKRRGNQFTYALLEERVKKRISLSTDEALQELTKRYFQSRGPATIKDFTTWSGLKLTECKRGLEMCVRELSKQPIGGEYYFTYHTGIIDKPFAGIHLLPIYDEFIMGYKDRSALFEIKNKIKPPPAFKYDCMITEAGQIIGTWKRTVTKKAVDIQYQFFKPLTKLQSNLFEKAIQRLGEFMNLPVAYERTK